MYEFQLHRKRSTSELRSMFAGEGAWLLVVGM
jgi:hypothetical protein